MVRCAIGKGDSLKERLVYHPEGIIVAEDKDRTFVLRAYKTNKGPNLYYQLVDKMMLRLLPKELKDSKQIGIYDAWWNLNRLMKMFEIF